VQELTVREWRRWMWATLRQISGQSAMEGLKAEPREDPKEEQCGSVTTAESRATWPRTAEHQKAVEKLADEAAQKETVARTTHARPAKEIKTNTKTKLVIVARRRGMLRASVVRRSQCMA